MIVDFNLPHYKYDNFIADAKSLTKQYEEILQNVTIGTSHDNRDIVLLKLGVGRQYMICCSGVHGRENINPMVLLKIIEYYAELYTNHRQEKKDLINKLSTQKQHFTKEYEQMLYGACIHELLRTFTILFVPLVNPDGYMISLDGFDAIKDSNLRQHCISMQIPPCEWKYNARAIDINRNFPSKLWKPGNYMKHAASEKETLALIQLFQKYRSKGLLDIHSRGKQIYYYRNMLPESYNRRQLEIANRLSETTGYALMPPEEEVEKDDCGGNTVHYFSEQFSKPALTIETIEEDATFPLDENYRFTTFEELKQVIFEFGSFIATT